MPTWMRAIRVLREEGSIQVQLLVTCARPECSLTVYVDEKPAGLWEGDLKPESPLRFDVQTGPGRLEIVFTQSGHTLLRYGPDSIAPMPKPEVAKEPPLPADVNTSDELFLTGLHLEQYRHPTRHAEDYWREAIRRDPLDSRANAALGRWHLRRGEFLHGEQHLRTAIARLTERNPNPADCEPFYNLGLTLSYFRTSSGKLRRLLQGNMECRLAGRRPSSTGRTQLCARRMAGCARAH